jgi:hypothetical protein
MITKVRIKLQYVLLLQHSKLEWHLELHSVLFCFTQVHFMVRHWTHTCLCPVDWWVAADLRYFSASGCLLVLRILSGTLRTVILHIVVLELLVLGPAGKTQWACVSHLWRRPKYWVCRAFLNLRSGRLKCSTSLK